MRVADVVWLVLSTDSAWEKNVSGLSNCSARNECYFGRKISLIVCRERRFLRSSSETVHKRHTCTPWQSLFLWKINMETSPLVEVSVKITQVFFYYLFYFFIFFFGGVSSLLWVFRTWFYPIEQNPNRKFIARVTWKKNKCTFIDSCSAPQFWKSC